MKLQVLFDNKGAVTGVKYGWGFACLVRTAETTLLFDTGADGAILLANMSRLGVDPREIDAVFLSHDHWDHTGGLGAVLEKNPEVEIHLTPAFSDELVRRAQRAGARVIAHGSSREIGPGLHTTGALEGPPEEHALVIELEQGLVVVTGCSHPGIAEMLELVAARSGKPILLAIGGYHLLHDSPAEIRATIERLRALGVRRVAPIHCTGARARRLLKAELGERFLAVGAGSEIDLASL
jgi:7,8-dihydropterin-6-yl-methyl-4-(beta-D-ribofuranosyl)aminobenzene 5'-phosphate synthase